MTFTPQLRIWHGNRGGDPTPTNVTQSIWFSKSSPTATSDPLGPSVGIRPIVPRATFIGVAMVPAELEERVTLNGTPMWSGMHGLRHGDRLAINGHNIWVAASMVVDPIAYDPAVHGQGLVCYLTRDRLAPGESIARCPGSNGKMCDVIYKKQAWDLAMQATPPMRCPNCGFRPGESQWEPPQDPVKRRMRDVLASITNGHE